MGSELVQYIYEQRKAGYSNEYIREQLRAHGWAEEVMAEAFNEAEEVSENKKWTIYSVGSIILIFTISLSMVGMARFTGFAPAGNVACVVENPEYPGYFDVVESREDCLLLMLNNMCEPSGKGVGVEADGKVIFEGTRVCRGKTNLYFG
ncbi:MAG: hypothetical protein ACE5FT_01530 [Candidatus Nanoarchaeia archaeon]